MKQMVAHVARLMLPAWRVNLYPEPSLKDGLPGWKCAARCEALWEYFEANVYVNLELFAELTTSEALEFVTHECAHALVCEMRPNRLRVSRHEERVVTSIARVFLPFVLAEWRKRATRDR